MQPLQRTTAESVVHYFKEKIMNGELKPGDRLLSERRLQQSFGISRFSLREGMARLSALGLIRIVHGKGAFVTEDVDSQSLSDVLLHLRALSGPAALELLETRSFLEGELSALACQRQTTAEILELEGNLDRTENQLADREAFCRCDLEFHQLIARMAKNRFLYNMHAVLWKQIFPVMLRNAQTEDSRVDILQRHRRMLDALTTRDPLTVRRLSNQFLMLGLENYY